MVWGRILEEFDEDCHFHLQDLSHNSPCSETDAKYAYNFSNIDRILEANEGPLILFLHGMHQVWMEPLNDASFCGREGKDKMSQFHFKIDGKFHTPTQQHSKTL